MPLGLLMLERKWITTDQLGVALRRQRDEKHGRLGDWLVATNATDEKTVARAIAVQWGVPLLVLHERTEKVHHVVPRLIIEAYEVIPVRTNRNRVLYLGINERLDPCLNVAIEKMTGLHVQPVVMETSEFWRLKEAALQGQDNEAQMFRSSTLTDLCSSMKEIVNQQPAVNIQLTSLKEYIWLRILRRQSAESAKTIEDSHKIEDIFFTYGPEPRQVSIVSSMKY
jgi:hypothetical protein